MEKRDTSSYNLIFNFINTKITNKPKFIIIDFEPAVLASLKILNQECFVSTCFFAFLSRFGGIFKLSVALLNTKKC
jgi:hypothetical protein